MEYGKQVFRPHRGETVEIPEGAVGVSVSTWGDPEKDGHAYVRYLVPTEPDECPESHLDWIDHKANYCPTCGKRLETVEKVKQ